MTWRWISRDIPRTLRLVVLATSLAPSLASRAAAAQTSTALITGTVTSAGVPVVSAAVIARSVSTNVRRGARTSGRGFYVIPGLTPDEYEITVSRIGMQPVTRRVRPLVGQSLSVDFDLLATTVQLSAHEIVDTRPSADRRTPEVATNVTTEQIEHTPLPDRNFLSLSLLAPGVRRDGGSVSSGAQSANNINVFIDGVSYKNDVLTGGAVGQDASKGNPFPQNAVQEFRIITQQYKAEYQKATSAIITATTKSGTNEWHGDAFSLLQNTNAIQQDYFTVRRCDSLTTAGSAVPCTPKPRLDKYQVGGTLGGPLVHDRLFLFGSYEGNLQTRASDILLGSNTATMPQRLQDSLHTFEGNYASPFRSHLGFAKLTYVPAERHRLELSGNLRHEYEIRSFGGTNSYENAEYFFNTVSSYQLRHQYALGNGLNEASASVQSYHWNPVPLYPDKVGINYSGVLKIGGRSSPQDFTQRRFSLRDDYTYTLPATLGDHVFKSGVTLDFLDYHVLKYLSVVPQYTFDATNSWAFPTSAVAGFGNPDLSAANHQFGAYVQDDWAVAPRLILNLGARWDYESDMNNNSWVTPDSIRSAVLAYRSTLACDGTNPKIEQLCDPSPYLTDGTQRPSFKGAIQPRLGFSYDLLGTGKTVLFGGWGLYYDRNSYNSTLNERANLQWAQYTFRFSSTGLPSGGNPTVQWQPQYFTRAGLESILRSGSAPRPELFLTQNQTVPPQARQFSAGVRQAVGDALLTANYVGVRGSHVFTWIRANRNANGSCCAAFPSAANRLYSNVFVSSDDARNWYDALYLSLSRRYSEQSRWGGQVSYTLGKAGEEASAGDVFSALNTFTVQDFTRYPTSSDERQHLTTNWIVGLPLDLRLSGIIDLGSGTPYNPTVGFGAGTNNCTYGNKDCLSGNDYPDGQARNWYRAPGAHFLGFGNWTYRDVDVRLEKDFVAERGQRVGVIGEVFNVFNFANFNGIDQNYGAYAVDGSITPNPTFATPRSVVTDLGIGGAPRRFQLGLNYHY